MSESKVTGVIDAIADYQSKDYFNIALGDAENDDNWYIGDNTLRGYGDFSKGDKVRITVDDNKGSVTNVEPVGKPNDVKGDESAGSESASNSAPNGSEGGQTSSEPHIPAPMQCALKEAVETARQADLLENEVENGEHMEKVSKLANCYYNILKDMEGDQ